MAGKFTLRITCGMKAMADYEKFRNIVKTKVDALTHGSDWNYYWDARKRRLIITVRGKPMRFQYLDDVAKSLRVNLTKYLYDWWYEIKVNYTEERE